MTIFLLVGMTRFERAASRSRTVRSSQTELHPVDKLYYAINSFISQVIISPFTNSPAACQKNVNFFKISFFRFFSATNLLMVALVFKYAKTFHYLYITGSLKSIFSQVNFSFFCISLQPRFLFHHRRLTIFSSPVHRSSGSGIPDPGKCLVEPVPGPFPDELHMAYYRRINPGRCFNSTFGLLYLDSI